MLVSKKVIAAINGQIGMEFAASIQYDAIGAHFDFNPYRVFPGIFTINQLRNAAMPIVS